MGKTVTVTLKADTKDAKRNLEFVTEEIREQKQITIEFERELQKLEEQLKKTPKNALAEQKKLKTQIDNLKTAIKDQNISLKELNNEKSEGEKANKKLTESTEDLTDSVTSNGGAMALLNQLTGGLAQQFKDSYEAIAVTNKSLKGLKGALLATGIGAAVLAIGLLVENFDKVKEVLSGVTAEQKRFTETQIEANAAASSASQSLKGLRDVVLDQTASENARREALNKLSETVVELQGVDLDQADALKLVRDETDKYIKAVEARAKAEAFAKIIAEEQANIIREQQKDLSEQVNGWDYLKAAISNFGNAAGTAGDVAAAGIEKQNEKVNKAKDLIAELEGQYKSYLTTALEAENVIGEGATNLTRGTIESVNAITTAGVQSSETQIKAATLVNTTQQKLSDEEIRRKQIEVEWENATQEQKLAVYAAGLNNFAQIFGKESAAGKAAAIASATISTYSSAVKSYESLAPIPVVGPALGFAAAGAAIAGGIANVQKIVSTPTPKIAGVSTPSGGGSISRPSGGGGGAAASAPPAFNIVGAGATNSLAEAIGSQEQKPVKAYVTTNDVTTGQALDRNIVQGASIG